MRRSAVLSFSPQLVFPVLSKANLNDILRKYILKKLMFCFLSIRQMKHVTKMTK
jgi:hypothetical protein